MVYTCCDGYARGEDESTCLPVCSDTCHQGTCVGPDTCHCDQGFGGKDCSKCKTDNSERSFCNSNLQFVSPGRGAPRVSGTARVRMAPRVTPCLASARVPRDTTGRCVTRPALGAHTASTARTNVAVRTVREDL